MNEIKFRIWDKKLKQIFTIYDLCNTVRFYNSDKKNRILLQFTGIKDKNHKEIFEGDIVKYIPNGVNFLVEFINGGWCITNSEHNSSNLYYLQGKFKVVGNVFENKELLK